LATFVLQAITGAHTPTCLLDRNRSRRNRDAPILAASYWMNPEADRCEPGHPAPVSHFTRIPVSQL